MSTKSWSRTCCNNLWGRPCTNVRPQQAVVDDTHRQPRQPRPTPEAGAVVEQVAVRVVHGNAEVEEAQHNSFILRHMAQNCKLLGPEEAMRRALAENMRCVNLWGCCESGIWCPSHPYEKIFCCVVGVSDIDRRVSAVCCCSCCMCGLSRRLSTAVSC